MTDNSGEHKILSHHKQLNLCTARLPYRQGRKLTAVKVYTINNESKHLLIFGVPSLNLRQETKNLFIKFGKLLQFNITKYPSERFTETYHAIYENIQSARIAKKMLDTKNFYGGNLHICYAPELESIQETREKLLLRQKSVIARLKNLEKEKNQPKSLDTKNNSEIQEANLNKEPVKINMADVNCIEYEKRKMSDYRSVKRVKYNSSDQEKNKISSTTSRNNDEFVNPSKNSSPNIDLSQTIIDVIDVTSPSIEIVTNINESLNFNNFGKELVKQVPHKPVNKIVFNFNKKS